MKYLVKSNLHHDGKPYAIGKTVSIDDEEQAKSLIDADVIEPAKEAGKSGARQ